MLKRIFAMVTAVSVLLTLVYLPVGKVVHAAGSTYYVDAVSGNDSSGNGSSGSPWKTIGKAGSMVQAGDTVKIRSGTYRETVTPANSGTASDYITFEADTGADVTISGANLVTSPWSVHSGNVYKTTTSLSMGTWKNQVFVDGVAMNLARWPNAGTNPMEPVFKEADTGTNNSKIVDSELTQANGYWNGAGVIAGDHYRWSIASATVTSYTTGQLNLSAHSTFGFGVNNGNGSPYYLIGKLAALDSANEWYYDSGSTTLYLQTPASDTPANHTVEVKARNLAFNLSNKDYIRIKGIKMFANTLNTDTSNYIEIDGIDAQYVSHYELSHISGVHQWPLSGIQLGGTYNVLKNSTVAYSPGNLVTMGGEHNQVINNSMHDAAYGPAYTTNQSNINADGKEHLISHNTLYNSGRQVIAGSTNNSRIQYNHGYNVMKLTDDGGFMYFSNVDGNGTEIHHNRFHGATSNPPHHIVGGIYLDFASFDFKVFNNVVSDVNTFGVFFHSYNLFTSAYNNTFYNTSKFRMKDDGGALDAYGTRVINNITYDDLDISPGFGILEKNNFTSGDPLFVNTANQDFRLQPGSSAIDGGAVIDGITDGYSGSAPDIGAYEAGGPSWSAGHNFASPPNPTFTTTDIPYHTLLTNGFFERETDTVGGWTKTHAQTAIIERSGSTASASRHAWTRGVRLGSGSDGVEQTVTGLSPNNEYELRGFGKAASSGQAIRIGVKSYGGSEMYEEVTSTTWSKEKIRFTTGGSNTSATIYIYKPSTGGNAYADDVTLVEVDPEAPDEGGSSSTPPPPPGTTRVNNSETGTGTDQFEFVGSWTYSTNIYAYEEDVTFSNAAGNYYQVRFEGEQIELYSELDTHMGIVGVSIDGGSETLVDLYSATPEDNKLVFTSPELTDGQHTLKVRITGTKNASATGTWHVADRVDIISSASADTEAPSAPTNLAVSSKTDASVSLNWTASTDNVGVTGYKIYRDGSEAGTTANTSYTDSPLSASTNYTYTVKAYDAADNLSSASSAVNTTTEASSGGAGLLSDDFESGTLGQSPSGWTTTTTGGTITVVNIADGAASDNQAMKIQRTSTGSGLSASQSFTASSGIVTIETRMRAAQTNALVYGPMISNSTGQVLIQLGFRENGNIGILDSSWVNLKAYSANQWYDIRIEADTDADTFDLYIDGIIELDDHSFKTASTNVFKIQFSPYSWNNGTVYYDNVQVSAAGANEAPTASNVNITGTAAVGQVLTGSYTYNDVDSDSEGTSTFKWYRGAAQDGSDKAAISGATATTYTLASADEGNYIFYEVTPVASSGTTIGTSVLSTPVYAAGSSLLSDDFEAGTIGQAPSGWSTTTTGGTITVEEIADGADLDNQALKIQRTSTGSGLIARKSFTASSGSITIETRMRAAQTNALIYGPKVKNSSGSDVIFLGFQANGTFGLLDSYWTNLRAYSANQWYDIRIVADTDTDTFDLYIDDTIELNDQSFKASTSDLAEIEFSPYSWNNGTVYYDNILVTEN